ncbi:unannotated protein [freshwater metagenome]|uniref:Unannotated protein n=1 Tax=freshwater metagenome TaxID=449393 RepID=A0A6J6H8B6_9ZZZZ|nr:hypothetical protein [Actinomycetota bacterium]
MSTNFFRSRRKAMSKATSILLVTLALGVAFTACGSSGRTLRDPEPGKVAPSRKSTATTGATSTSAPAGGAVITGSGLSIKTTAWSAGGAIPKAYGCDGANTSPPLLISGASVDVVELVLIVSDQTAGGTTNWVVSKIGPATAAIPQGGAPTGAIQIPNDSGSALWSGPCPDNGTHTYDFTLYGLSQPSGLTASSTRADIDAAVANPRSVSVITGTYKRS